LREADHSCFLRTTQMQLVLFDRNTTDEMD
jgi:hypothetical protein